MVTSTATTVFAKRHLSHTRRPRFTPFIYFSQRHHFLFLLQAEKRRLRHTHAIIFPRGGGISRASAGSADLVTATPPDTDSNLVGRTEQMMMTGTRCDLCEWEVSAHPHGVQSRPAGCYTCWPINNTQAFFLFKDV